MCNRYANTVSYRQYVEEFSETRLPLLVPAPSNAPNLEPRADIRPTDHAPVLLPIEGGLELREMRWGLIPWFHKKTVKEWKPLTTNARSETIDTTASFKSAFARRRCLIPVSSFYEWTGEKGRMAFCCAGRRVVLLCRHLGPRPHGRRRYRELRARDAATRCAVRAVP